jgi:hypothetical protein
MEALLSFAVDRPIYHPPKALSDTGSHYNKGALDNMPIYLDDWLTVHLSITLV